MKTLALSIISLFIFCSVSDAQYYVQQHQQQKYFCRDCGQETDRFGNHKNKQQTQFQNFQQTQVRLVKSSGYGQALEAAKKSAMYRAQNGQHGHCGHDLNTGLASGVGFSTFSAQDAIDRCCYSGHRKGKGAGRPRVATAVAQGPSGYYACILCR